MKSFAYTRVTNNQAARLRRSPQSLLARQLYPSESSTWQEVATFSKTTKDCDCGLLLDWVER